MRDTEVLCWPVPVRALFAPTRGLHFQDLYPLTFLFISTLRWCKHCTSLEVASSLRKFPLTALCVVARYGGVLQARSGGCAFCTNNGFAFSGSPSPYLPFQIHLALVQALYQARGSLEFKQISFHGPMRRCWIRRCFAGQSRWVRFLHQQGVCNFGLSIPLPSFSYPPCVGASIVPG